MPKPGYITPSRFSDVMTRDKTRTGFGKTALSYANEIVLGLLGVPMPEIKADALEWGLLNEKGAVKRYETENFVPVTPVTDSIVHPQYPFICGKPDGLVCSNGIIEVKCPFNSMNHLNNLKTAAQYADYKWQIQGYLWITEREWCDFISYDPRFPEHLSYACHMIQRDDALIAELEERCLQFWDIVQAEYGKLCA